jgi:signal transduction histidine kinase
MPARQGGHAMRRTERDVGNFFGRFSRASMALVCAGFSACVLMLCLLGGAHFKHGAEQELYRETENTAQILMTTFDEDAANVDAILTRLASQIKEPDVSIANEPELYRLLARYALTPSMIGPAIIDRNGILIASARTNNVPKISMKDRNTFLVHAMNPAESKLYVSAPMRGLLSNEWAIQFSRPLRDETGTFYGVVLVSYRLSHFVELYEKLKLSDNGLAGLTGKDGVVRIRSLSGVIGYGTAVPKIALVYERVLAGETSGTFFGRADLDNITRIGSFVASKTTPFYVSVGYDIDYLRARYIGFFYVLGLCWFVLTAAMIATVAFVRRLEHISQQNQLAVINSAVAERQKISADMHDSIGASLATLLAHFTIANINVTDVKRRIGEILMELRFLVDSAEPVDGDLNLVLSNVRHRMGSGIELTGMELQWQVDELPTIVGLTARDALSIKLILMEALSNVMHHSKASSVTVTAGYTDAASLVVITVKDDGCGFNATDAAVSGRGLANMRKRIRSVLIGGALDITSLPGQGTAVRIELNVPTSAR